MIKLFVTGGTIDKVYHPTSGRLGFAKTHIYEALLQGNSKLDVEIETIFLKDSLDIEDYERKMILQRCQAAQQRKIVITHGTDTMVTTARMLADDIFDKTIVLTGAMVPFTIKNSDVLFNLGCALGIVQYIKTGVYICMHGKIFNHNNVIKDKELYEFIKLK